MAYDDQLAQRVRLQLRDQAGFSEKAMFGGICFLLNGNMCSGIVRNELMLRVGPDQHDRVLKERHARPMDFTGRPMKGMIYVSAEGVETDAELRRWLQLAILFTGTLPSKKPKQASARTRRSR